MHQSVFKTGLRPPAVPLVTCDPYFSVWSLADQLTDDVTRHWTGVPQALEALVRVDGGGYRIMGTEPRDLPALPQTGLAVLPLRTIATFEGAGIRLELTFMTPMLPHDLDALSRPITYITWEVASLDGLAHTVSLFFGASAMLSVERPEQNVIWSRLHLADGIEAIAIGSQEQRILGRAGDHTRIDWGFVYGAVQVTSAVSAAVGQRGRLREAFVSEGHLPDGDDPSMPRSGQGVGMAFVDDLGEVGTECVHWVLVLAYDDVFSVEYLHRRLSAYWRRNGSGPDGLIVGAFHDYRILAERCASFDAELMTDMTALGGEKYAALGALAFRQCLAAQKLVADVDGTPLLFSKENDSNGCMATVDVAYPTAPFFLVFHPPLLEATLRPILAYARLPRWRHPFAPHDLGTYPLANGQRYGGGEETLDGQMPIEECGNLLLMASALAEAMPDAPLLRQYVEILDAWANYLLDHGYDPENQLCTDDFAGHLAHNTNLSIKAIVALAAYGQWCLRSGRPDEGERYREAATVFARNWVREADDGDHFRLAFDQPGTWSQKYNLVWDQLLGLGVFPPQVAEKEIAFYRTKRHTFGLPLDNRADWAKLDWTVWTATLAERPEDRDALLEPLYAFVDQTPDRVPLTDWYWTSDARWRGFKARSVVGGVFLLMLADPELRRKWRGR